MGCHIDSEFKVRLRALTGHFEFPDRLDANVFLRTPVQIRTPHSRSATTKHFLVVMDQLVGDNHPPLSVNVRQRPSVAGVEGQCPSKLLVSVVQQMLRVAA